MQSISMQCLPRVFLVEPVRWLKAHGKFMIIIHNRERHVEIWKVSKHSCLIILNYFVYFINFTVYKSIFHEH